jgi:hypothetical protein
MPISQNEADRLRRMTKEFAEPDLLEFSNTQPMRYQRALVSLDRRERFLLDLERGRRKRTRLRYQTRGREVIVLARFEIDGPDHINPPTAPHRPGERIPCPHMHLYVEGFEDRVAFAMTDVPELRVTDGNNGLALLEDFLRFCGVQHWPAFQLSV